MTNLIGKYQISKSNLVGDSLHLVISERKKPEINKPKRYLLLKTGEKTFKYVSSLYPSKVDAMSYEIDFNGIKYLLQMDTDTGTAKIDLLEVVTNGLSISMSISAVEAHLSDNQNNSL